MSNDPSQPQQVNLQIRYEELDAKYANQVLINPTAEEIYLDFSPGVVNTGTGQAMLPITTRVVMTPAGALRLHQALGQTLQNYQVVQTTPPPAVAAGNSTGSSESAAG